MTLSARLLAAVHGRSPGEHDSLWLGAHPFISLPAYTGDTPCPTLVVVE